VPRSPKMKVTLCERRVYFTHLWYCFRA